MGQHVAVTGGAGRLGNSLVRRLLETGERIRVLDIAPHGHALVGLDVERVEGSILDVEALDALLDGARGVFHCCARVDLGVDRDGSTFAINVAGTRLVADACAARGIRMVHTSSHAALDRAPLTMPLTEENPLALADACDYHRSKAHSERVVLERVALRSLDAVIVSPGTLVGPHDYEPSIFGAAMIDLFEGKIPILLDAVTDYCDVRDVVDAMIAAMERGRTGERYLLTGEVLGIREVARAVEHATGRRMPRRALPLWVGWLMLPSTMAIARLRGRDPLYSAGMLRASVSNPIVSHAKAARELGYSLRPLKESLVDAFAFYEERGYLTK